MSAIHPEQVLYASRSFRAEIPLCEHFAGTEKNIQKSLKIQNEKGPVFDLTIDLEDGTSSGSEEQKARFAGDVIASGDNQFLRTGVRIHDFTHPSWKKDIDLVFEKAGQRVAYFVIPKIQTVQQLEAVLEYLELSAGKNQVRKRVPVHVLVETKTLMEELEEAGRMRMLETLDFGLMDYIADFEGAIPSRAVHSPFQFEHPLIRRAKTKISVIAHTHGLVPSHNVTVDLQDPEQAFRDARRAKDEFGYGRMWSIHPMQIEPIIRGLSPEVDEVEESAEVLLRASDASWGPIEFEGKLYDRASYRSEWSTLKRYVKAGNPVPGNVAHWFDGP